MAQPRQIGSTSGGRKLGKDRNAVQQVIHEVTKQENRKALITVGMFVVSWTKKLIMGKRYTNCSTIGWSCILS